jgi:hypothetical protein
LPDLGQPDRLELGTLKSFYREGEYGEFILPNQIKTSRESLLYVSYVRNDDGTREWLVPRSPFEFEGRIHSGTIRVLEALYAAGIFGVEALKVFRDYWRKIPFVDIGSDPLAVGPETFSRLHLRALRHCSYGPQCYNLEGF